MRRIRGPEETYQAGGLSMASIDAELLRIEPSFQILLDEVVIGTMKPLTKIGEPIRNFLPSPPVEESAQFEIQAGYHTLRIEAKRPFYKTVLSKNQSFDIAPGATVRFFCQYAQADLNKVVWRVFIGPYKHKIVLQRE
jgi:hypothetical protein